MNEIEIFQSYTVKSEKFSFNRNDFERAVRPILSLDIWDTLICEV